MRAILLLSLSIAIVAPAADAAALRLQVNHSVRLHLAGRASAVIIGNPKVADATVVDSGTVFVSGRALGSTDVVVTDALGRTLFHGDVDVAPVGSAVTLFNGTQQQALACAPVCRPQDSGVAPTAPAAAPMGYGGVSAAPGAPTLASTAT